MKTVTGTIKDKVGNQQSCNLSLGAYVDKTPPNCTRQQEFHEWTKNNRTVIVGCNDAHSGCDSRYSKISKNITTSIATIRVTGIIKDNVGNQTNCNLSLGAYVDKDDPYVTFVKRCIGSNHLRVDLHEYDNHSGVDVRILHYSQLEKGTNTVLWELTDPNKITYISPRGYWNGWTAYSSSSYVKDNFTSGNNRALFFTIELSDRTGHKFSQSYGPWWCENSVVHP